MVYVNSKIIIRIASPKYFTENERPSMRVKFPVSEAIKNCCCAIICHYFPVYLDAFDLSEREFLSEELNIYRRAVWYRTSELFSTRIKFNIAAIEE